MKKVCQIFGLFFLSSVLAHGARVSLTISEKFEARSGLMGQLSRWDVLIENEGRTQLYYKIPYYDFLLNAVSIAVPAGKLSATIQDVDADGNIRYSDTLGVEATVGDKLELSIGWHHNFGPESVYVNGNELKPNTAYGRWVRSTEPALRTSVSPGFRLATISYHPMGFFNSGVYNFVSYHNNYSCAHLLTRNSFVVPEARTPELTLNGIPSGFRSTSTGSIMIPTGAAVIYPPYGAQIKITEVATGLPVKLTSDCYEEKLGSLLDTFDTRTMVLLAPGIYAADFLGEKKVFKIEANKLTHLTF